MHDILRRRLMRKLESLPEQQIYQVLDYIEFLEAKYGAEAAEETKGLQRFAERLEDQLRRRTVSPANIREAFQLISAADRVLSNVSSAGKQILAELNLLPEDEASTSRDRPSPQPGSERGQGSEAGGGEG